MFGLNDQALKSLKAMGKKHARVLKTRKGNKIMKKKVFLQLFAEAAEGTAETKAAAETTETKADQTKEPGKDDKEQPKYTDKDLDEIINKRFARWQKEQDKAVAEARRLAEMNATEKAEYERDQLRKELDALKKKDSLAEMTKTARKMLNDDGINVPDELLSIMVTTDAAETKSAVDGFKKVFKEAVEAAVKERLKGEPPKKGSGGGVAPMTKEQIMAIKDHELRQKKMLENRSLFNL